MMAADGAMCFTCTRPRSSSRAYDQTRDLCMTLQAAVKFKEYFRCYVVGQKDVRIMPYDPSRPHAERYVMDPPEYDKKLLARVEKDAIVTLCKALGYDLNTVEFAVRGWDSVRDRLYEPGARCGRALGGQGQALSGSWIRSRRLAVAKAQKP